MDRLNAKLTILIITPKCLNEKKYIHPSVSSTPMPCLTQLPPFLHVVIHVCKRQREGVVSVEQEPTQPFAPLISSVNAVEITAVEVKHVSQ